MSDNDLPLPYNLKFFRGDTFRRGIRLKTESLPQEYISLTGVTCLAQVRQYEGGPLLVQLSATPDADQVTNKGLLWLVSNDTSFPSLPLGFEGDFGVWDLQLTWPSTDVITYLEGNTSLEGDVSRA